jgi:hypothetical protein
MGSVKKGFKLCALVVLVCAASSVVARASAKLDESLHRVADGFTAGHDEFRRNPTKK